MAVLVLRAIELLRYGITISDEWQIPIGPSAEMGLFWSGSAELYPSDPFLPERMRLRSLFDHLMKQWRNEQNPLSSNAWDNVLIPAYQRIIGMGTDAVPFILQELRYELEKGEPYDWFLALWAITGENPVPVESRGKVKEMAKAWLEWGFREGYLDGEELGARIPASGPMGRT